MKFSENEPIPPEWRRGYSSTLSRLEEQEGEHGLLTLEIRGVRLWQLVRGRCFTQKLRSGGYILERESKSMSLTTRVANRFLALLENPASTIQTSPAATALRHFREFLMYPLTRLQSWRNLKQPPGADILVSRFTRLVDNRYFLIAEAEAGPGTIVLTKPKFANPLTARNVLIEDIRRAAGSEAIEPLQAGELKQIRELAGVIESICGVSAEKMEKILQTELVRFLQLETVLSRFLFETGVASVHLCWNAIYFPLIAAAKKAGIRTIEYQHGSITAYHSNYSFARAMPMPYLPDEIRFFGRAWHEQASIPPNVECVDAGAPFLKQLIGDYARMPKRQNTVLVVSQTIVGVHLFRFTVAVARLRPDLEFIFKLHPAERYQNLRGYVSNVPDNIKVVGGRGSAYRLMAQASYQMGVSSTTLVEGFAFGNRAVVVALPSCEYMDNEIERGHASLAETPLQAAKLLSKETPLCDDVSLYFSNLENPDVKRHQAGGET